MSSKPAVRKNLSDIVKEMKKQQRKGFGQARQGYSGLASADFGAVSSSASSGAGTTNTSINITGLLKTSGDTMIGPIAFYPSEPTISAGVLTVSEGTDGYSSRVVITVASPTDLDTITGAAYAGQLLFLQADGNTITLKHGTGNITTPDSVDFDVVTTGIALLQYDTLGAGAPLWRVVATYGGGSGGAPTEVFDWTADHRANGNSFWLDTNDDTGIDSIVDDTMGFVVDSGYRMVLTDTALTLKNTINLLPEGSNTVTIGSSSKEFAAINANSLKMWDDVSNSVVTTEGRLSRNSTRGIVIKSPTVSSSFGKVTFTDKDGLDRIIFDYTAANKVNYFNYSTGGLRIRKNADVGDTIDVVPTGNVLFGNNSYINSNGNGWTSTDPDDGFIIARVGLEKMKFTNTLIEVNEATDFSDEPISSVGEISFFFSTQKISSNTGGIDYQVPSGDNHEFFVAGTTIVEITDEGLEVEDGHYIQPTGTGDEIGIMPRRTASTLSIGNRGSVVIPNVETTTTATDAQLDSWFGNQAGCFGMKYDTSKATGSGRMQLYIRGSAGSTSWRAVEFDVNP